MRDFLCSLQNAFLPIDADLGNASLSEEILVEISARSFPSVTVIEGILR